MRNLGQMLGHEISQILFGGYERHVDMPRARLVADEAVTNVDVS